MSNPNRPANSLVGISAHASVSGTVRTPGCTCTYKYSTGVHIVADLRHRIADVKANGDDRDARIKLRNHCVIIAISMVLTIAVSFCVAAWIHWDGVIPIAPSWLQELHDWIYKL